MIGSRSERHRKTIQAAAANLHPNKAVRENLSPLERLAAAVTDKVGTMGFFFIILAWTIGWTSYNILASKVPALHWHAFDPFPAFVAYLLISNVIQILLMPLIMVGQNVQGRHSEARAEADFAVNTKAFADTERILKRLEEQDARLLELASTSQEILRRLAGAENESAPGALAGQGEKGER